MYMETDLYTHSGRLGSALFVVPLVGIVVAFVCAVVYAYADVYIPIAGYVSFILTVGFAFGVGLASGAAAVWAKCRSTGFLVVCGGVIGLIALYFSWATFEYVLISRDESIEVEISLFDVLLKPVAVWELANMINETGWYEIRGGTPKGGVLWAFWGIEALIVVVGVAILTASNISGRVFCERCDRWCKTATDFMRLTIPEEPDLQSRIAGGQLDALGELEVVPANATPYLRVDVDQCQSCSDTATWKVSLVTHEPTKDGKIEEKLQTVSEPRNLGHERMQQLTQLAARPPIDIPEPEGAPESVTEPPDDQDQAAEATITDSSDSRPVE